MDEELRLLDYYTVKSQMLTDSLLMAMNGAFFTTRRSGITATPYQIENAKTHVHTAIHIFLDGVDDLLNQIDSRLIAIHASLNEQLALKTQNYIKSIAVEVLHQVNHALSTGIQNKAVELLGKNNAHGAIGLLVQSKMSALEIVATDKAGRKWKEPSSLVKTIIRDYAYQTLVDYKIKAIESSGVDLISVPGIDTPVSISGKEGYVALVEVRDNFHPNGRSFPVEF